jgi:hypothetical protein
VLKKLGRILSAPIRIPIQKGKQKAMNAVVLMLLRNGLKVAGMAGVLSDSQYSEAAGAISLIGGLAWSGFNAWREQKATQSSVTSTPTP